MISSTVTVIEGSSVSQLDEVFEKINRQANGLSRVRKEWVYIFYPKDESIYFYSNPSDGQIVNLQRGKAEGNFDLMRIKPSAGCIAAILLPKPYKEISSSVYRDALHALDTEERLYNLRQDCMFCDGERIGITDKLLHTKQSRQLSANLEDFPTVFYIGSRISGDCLI